MSAEQKGVCDNLPTNAARFKGETLRDSKLPKLKGERPEKKGMRATHHRKGSRR